MAIISYDKNLYVPYVPLLDRESMGKKGCCVVWIKTTGQGNADSIRERALRKTKVLKTEHLKAEKDLKKWDLENGEIDSLVLTAEMKNLFIENVGKIENYNVEEEGKKVRPVKDSSELYEIAEPGFIVDVLNAIQNKAKLEEGQKKTSKPQSSSS